MHSVTMDSAFHAFQVIKNELSSASNANNSPYVNPDGSPNAHRGREGEGKGDGNATHDQHQHQAAWQDRYKKLRPHLHTMRKLLTEGISNLVLKIACMHQKAARGRVYKTDRLGWSLYVCVFTGLALLHAHT